MLLVIKILVAMALGYLILYKVIPPGNFIYEGLRLPMWLLKLQSMVDRKNVPQKLKYGSHFRQYVLHYQPLSTAPSKNYIVIYIHGSGWQFGRPEMFAANAQWLTGQGYHAFFVSHRRIPRCDIREFRMDTALAIKKIVETLGEQGLQDKKILLSGNSAGGHLCALAMLDRSLLAEVGLSPAIFSAIALFATPLDLSVMWPSPPLLMLTRMKNPAIFKLANPILYLETALEIPTLLIHGDRDGIAEYQNSVVFDAKLRALGTRNISFATLKNGMHLDSASWCIPAHPCCKIFKDWLESIDDTQFGSDVSR